MNEMLSWRAKALDSSDLSKNARYLLLYLSTHMNDWGESAFPSIATIAGRTLMSRRTVYAALAELVDAKWLIKQNRYRQDGGQTTNNYLASHPDQGPLKQNGVQSSHEEGAVLAPPPSSGRTHNSSVNSSAKPLLSCALFEKWWEVYPKKVAKKSCLAKWKGMGLEARGEALIADVRKRLRLDRKWKEDYAPNPLTYLNGERWEDQIEPVRPERPVNGVPTTPRGWHSWCKGNGLGDGPRGYSEDQFVAWAQKKYKEKSA